jgi:hypothetical protein
MSPQSIFLLHLVLGYVACLLCFSVYVFPALKSMDRVEAQRANRYSAQLICRAAKTPLNSEEHKAAPKIWSLKFVKSVVYTIITNAGPLNTIDSHAGTVRIPREDPPKQRRRVR